MKKIKQHLINQYNQLSITFQQIKYNNQSPCN